MGNCCLPRKKETKEDKAMVRTNTRDTHLFTLNPGDFVKLNFKSIQKDYHFDSIIGRGSFGQVWLAIHRNLSQKRAIKQINLTPSTEGEIEKLLREVSILKHLDHPHIIRIYDVYRNKNKVFIVTEFCEGGELFDRIQKLTRFTENQAAKYMLDIVSAVMYCHDSDIIHRDLKPENFLFDVAGEGEKLKLIDFGSSRFLSPDKKLKKIKGTFFYMAPEVLSKQYDKKADVWSLGVILYAMLCGSLPFPGFSTEEIVACIKNAPLEFNQGCWDNVSEDVKVLLRKMLEKNPEQRYSIDQVFNDEWLQSRGQNRVLDKELNKESIKRLVSYRTQSKLQKTVYFYMASQMLDSKTVEDLSLVFKLADKNCDGFLSTDEILRATENVGLTVDVYDVLTQCDVDKNGLVNYTEFLAGTVNQQIVYNRKNFVSVFERFDKNGDGKIDLEELKEALGGNASDEGIRSMIDEADRNRDGVIDLEEFMVHMRGYANLVERDNS